MSKGASAPQSRLYLLALGLVIGFVTGFVVLLAHLPVEPLVQDYRQAIATDDRAEDAGRTGSDFDFYRVLPGTGSRTEASAAPAPGSPRIDVPASTRGAIPDPAPVIPPATRVVPGQALPVDPARGDDALADAGASRYYLQSGGIYDEPAQAERRRAAVLLTGLDATILTYREADGDLGYRVRIGPYRQDDERFLDAMHRLRRAELGYEIVRISG